MTFRFQAAECGPAEYLGRAMSTELAGDGVVRVVGPTSGDGHHESMVTFASGDLLTTYECGLVFDLTHPLVPMAVFSHLWLQLEQVSRNSLAERN